MKTFRRRVVQHGPCTLTVSLPAPWTKEHGVARGDDVKLHHLKNGLLVTADEQTAKEPAAFHLHPKTNILAKVLGALYKKGHDEIIVTYEGTEELEQLHSVVSTGYIGFEIVEETSSQVIIRKVSEPDKKEFSRMFRRIFHFLNTIAEEGVIAARNGDRDAYQKLVLRDKNVDKLTDFCRRVVCQHGQSDYQNDPAIYHVIEQLEKISDLYKYLNKHLISQEDDLGEEECALYEEANTFLREYENMFFSFSIEKAMALKEHYKSFMERAADVEEKTSYPRALYLIEQVPREVYNLLGVTMMLNL